MEQSRFNEFKEQGLSKQDIFSLASKENLVENLKMQARMTQANDDDINTSQDIEDKRFSSYTGNEKNENHLKSQEKPNSAIAAVKLLKFLLTIDTRHKDYLTEQAGYSPKARAVAEKISTETGGKVQCVVDKEFIETFGDLVGVKYRGSALMGNRIIARDEKVLEDEGLMRHESIHCMQQRDLNDGKPGRKGFAKRLILSGKSFAGLQNELAGSPEAAIYATQNQITEWETYANQLNPDYLEKRESLRFKEANTPEGRKAIVTAYMEREAKQYQEQIDTLMQQYHKEENIYQKAKIIQKVTDIKKFFSLQEELDPEDWKYFIILKDEIPEHLAEDPSFQIKFETKDNREKRNNISKS